MLEKDRKASLDVDECVLGCHMCDHICHHTAGSLKCSCQSGYLLMADLITCTDIGKCTEPRHMCNTRQTKSTIATSSFGKDEKKSLFSWTE
ncbi:fibulin-5-like [Montipora foliosa]|uniref:fibulin-5-like n=1 Tax=Montipora foliosa TaxID=591990 RepID=UPI0035F2126E